MDRDLSVMEKILFVCHGNICRSPMAEFIMKKMVRDAGREDEFEIDSAATSCEEIGNDIYPPAKDTLRKHDIPFAGRHARRITQEDYDLYDHIFIMDRNNLNWLRRMFPADAKVQMLMSLAGEDRDVADPWYTGDFEATYDDICRALRAFLAADSAGKNADRH